MKSKRYISTALLAILVLGLSHNARAASCDNANCWLNQQEANDPGYQSAVRGSRYSTSSSSSSNFSNSSTYSDRSANYYYDESQRSSLRYTNTYKKNGTVIDSYRKGGCKYTVRWTNGKNKTTKKCSN